jgi:hypothetical protein
MTTVMTPTEADLSVANCPLCELGEAPLSRPKRVGDVIAVHADPSMVVFLQPPLQLVAVAPTCHVDDLSHFEAGGLGSFLAALRRVALNVRLVFGCSETTIAPGVERPNGPGRAACRTTAVALLQGVWRAYARCSLLPARPYHPFQKWNPGSSHYTSLRWSPRTCTVTEPSVPSGGTDEKAYPSREGGAKPRDSLS